MKRRIGTSGVSTEDLQLYFDGELGGAEARELAAQIEAEPELKAELEQLGLLRGLVSEGLTAKAREVPQARFEQIWDEIDRTLEKDARQAEAAAGPLSLWARLSAALRPWRVPVAAVLGAAAAVVVVMNVGSGAESEPDSTNNAPIASSEQPASESAPPAEGPNPAPEPGASEAVPPTMLAQSPTETDESSEVFPQPKAVEAEIHRVEFGGSSGRISRGGTVTVLYVDEDVEPKDSERSL
jgi:hypothetical protein